MFYRGENKSYEPGGTWVLVLKRGLFCVSRREARTYLSRKLFYKGESSYMFRRQNLGSCACPVERLEFIYLVNISQGLTFGPGIKLIFV